MPNLVQISLTEAEKIWQ